MNALFGVPDVKEMWYRGIKLKSVPPSNGHECSAGKLDCHFYGSNTSTCKKFCIEDRIWIQESQIPEYLAIRLVEESPR